MELTLQSGATLTIGGVVSADGAPVDLSGQAVTASLIAFGTTHALTAAITDAAAGAFAITIDDSVSSQIAPGTHASLRLSRTVDGEPTALGVVAVKVV